MRLAITSLALALTVVGLNIAERTGLARIPDVSEKLGIDSGPWPVVTFVAGVVTGLAAGLWIGSIVRSRLQAR
jgi:hypothetical protein